MGQRNVVGQSALRRYVFRRDFARKVKARVDSIIRKSTKDAFADQNDLLTDLNVEVIFDIGANIGAVTQIYQKLFPTAHIYSFEPSPETYKLLEMNFASESHIHTNQLAISDEVGVLQFNVNHNSGTSSVFEPSAYNSATWARKGRKATVDVPSVTVDSVCTEWGINHINILKLDIEGSELPALRGASMMLKSSSIDIIYTEVCFSPIYVEQPLLHNIVLFLEQYDYRLFNIYSIVESKIKQGLISNAIFLSPTFRNQLQEKWGRENCGW